MSHLLLGFPLVTSYASSNLKLSACNRYARAQCVFLPRFENVDEHLYFGLQISIHLCTPSCGAYKKRRCPHADDSGEARKRIRVFLCMCGPCHFFTFLRSNGYPRGPARRLTAPLVKAPSCRRDAPNIYIYLFLKTRN